MFPFKKFEDAILNWQQTYTLNREEYLDTIDTALYMNRQDEEVSIKINRLRDLITWNYSYSVIKAIEQAKITLSSQESAWIEVGELDLAIEIPRQEFQQIIADLMDQIGRSIDVVLAKASMDERCIDRVITTGGSSLIPAVQRMLTNRFTGRVTTHSEFNSIAAGLAIANYNGYQYHWE
jgi:hypothetical chaperone protein